MIILIEGPINAGKTTVSQCLRKMIPNTAHVEVDDLRHFVTWMPLEEAIPLALANAACVTVNFVQAGLHVVLSYPLGQEDYNFLKTQFEPLNTPIHCFTLRPTLEVNLTNRGTRALTDHERARIKSQHQTRASESPIGTLIDNSTQTPEETAQQIVDMTGIV